jgi:hypothetical protein
MTGNVLDRSSAGFLILILPLAFAVVILYQFWQFILALAVLIVGWKIWQEYQWQKWCEQINPYFNQIIKDNGGYVTFIDLTSKANLSPRTAKIFLNRKADEYGVVPKFLKDKGVLVYYFPTASALGSIFDASEPIEESQQAEEEEKELFPITTPETVSTSSTAKQQSKFSLRGIAQLAREAQNQTETASESTTAEDDEVEPATTSDNLSTNDTQEFIHEGGKKALIQADLAKRLDLNSSTVGRRKTKPDFPEWSQSKDPDGIAWQYIEDKEIFVPLNNN